MSIPTSFTVPALVDASVSIITAGQAPSGAYVASPTFSQYGYGWLRDGAYVALAMDATGRRDSAARFHEWVSEVVRTRGERIRGILERLASGEEPHRIPMLPTRYELDGTDEPHDADWPNFQLDGYGIWLFALHSHVGGALPERFAEAVGLAADYLAATWRLPCYDYWEESGDRRHTSTLAAIAAGLRASARLLDRAEDERVADEIVAFIRRACTRDGCFVKGPDDARVDASLLSLRTPFALVPADDPVMAATVARIDAELSSPTGGIRRYVGDTYYGGSPWPLLTAWLGWHERHHGDPARAAAAALWIRERAGADGRLAEQDVTEPQAPEWVAPWEERWGSIADPLLWSHAKYILLERGGEPAEWS